MVPFVDLRTQYHNIQREIGEAISHTLESSEFILGREVGAFEEEFAAYSGAKIGIGVNSGTSALHLALLAAGVGEGDEVITTAFTFVATVAAIRYTGARPVLVDIDPVTYNIDPSRIESAVTEKSKVILPVHLYGHPADMDPILEIARRHNLIVIEDAAQAHGAKYKGRECGSLGHMACFSFYPTKNLGTYGEGGMVVTNNPEFAKTVRLLRDWGTDKTYHHILRGFNYRMEGIHGAILRVKFRHLEAWTEARIANGKSYNEMLQETGLQTPVTMPDTRHVFNVYALMAPNRDQVQRELQAQQIQSRIHYPATVYGMPAHADLGQQGDCPNAERAAEQELSLPISPELTSEHIEAVTDCIKKVVRFR